MMSKQISSSQVLTAAIDPKGLPFKPIKGPKSKYSKIGIVGAGPSGVHMAYMLKKKGFDNIIILEKSNRIGGKSETMRVRGTNQILSTTFWTANYYNSTIVDLFNKFGLLNDTNYQMTTPLESLVVWNTNDANASWLNWSSCSSSLNDFYQAVLFDALSVFFTRPKTLLYGVFLLTSW